MALRTPAARPSPCAETGPPHVLPFLITALVLLTLPLGAQEAAAQTPAAEKPAAEKPAAEKPAAEKPAAEKPAAEKPAAEKPAAQEPAAQTPAAQEPAAPPEYVGSEMCQACHEDIFASFQKKNAHATLEKQPKRGWEGKACESCHGLGSKHAESLEAKDIVNPSKLAPMRTDALCLGCHLNTPTHIGRVQGGHAKGQVSCVGCHPVHKADGHQVERRHSRINVQCAGCHTDVWTSFQRPHTHQLNRGAMSCVDCHNPHGSFLPKNLQTALSNEPGCFNCHGDKRGPFAFEHAPLRLDGCGSCHEPHGSANPRMLIRHEVPNLCLECHSGIFGASGTTSSGVPGGIPPAFHDLRSARFRNCTICHVKIHGSHISRDFLR